MFPLQSTSVISSLYTPVYYFHDSIRGVCHRRSACISFFRAFEENYILVLEEDNRHFLYAVDINQGEMRFYLYTNDSQNSIMDSINFLKSNDLYPCEFEVILNENGKIAKNL